MQFVPETEEQSALRKLARDVADRELAPRAAHWDETEEFPHESWRAIADAGLFGVTIGEEFGGAGGMLELIVCAGYDAILERAFIRQFAGRVINIHPSLLPDFAGTMDAVEMALEARVSETGCTVHVVTNDVDQGPILAQSRVQVQPDDTVDTLRERIQAEEHVLLPAVVRRLAGQALPIPV